MKSRLPKVLHTVGGRAMIIHVIETALQLHPAVIHVVHNPHAPEIKSVCSAFDVNWVPQEEQLGTGHAVMQAMPGIPADAHVLVLYGDIPLLDAVVLGSLVNAQIGGISVLTMAVPDPTGYGRVLTDREGNVRRIVEERDASPEQRAIKVVNSGIIMAGQKELWACLENLSNENSQNEYYLTDIFSNANEAGIRTRAVMAPDARDLEGANDRVQLAALERRHNMKMATKLMEAGVQLADPARIDVRGRVETGEDVYLDVNVVLEGEISLGDGVQIGPGCVLKDCQLAAGTRVHAYSVLEGMCSLGACDIGPFARVRPGTRLLAGSKVGNFVEVKNTTLGKNSKASHLSYLGDSSIGDRVNIGAGTITCNYDGREKHHTTIEDDVFIGSDTQLVAPVVVGEGADIGAGTTVTRDVPAGQLTISRVKQRTIPGWKRPKKGKG
jgi:bifunctional UDP-N-acetylglucosamine pyrophosphorylase/glucosamine-1-phosphate N-acetyltransferase